MRSCLVQIACLPPAEVVAVYTQFKRLVTERMAGFKNPFDRNHSALSFIQAIPHYWHKIFPVNYIVPLKLVTSGELFGSHTVVAPAAAEKLRALLKRNRESDEEDCNE
jgi:hypothetical protein